MKFRYNEMGQRTSNNGIRPKVDYKIVLPFRQIREEIPRTTRPEAAICLAILISNHHIL